MIDEKKLIEVLKSNMNRNGHIFIDLETLIRMIENMPKVGEWIPCSERLPDEARAIEVTMYDGNRAIGHFYKRMESWFDSINGGTIDVIAWKEPSEPWEGEEL